MELAMPCFEVSGLRVEYMRRSRLLLLLGGGFR